jgi:hypothetical protein
MSALEENLAEITTRLETIYDNEDEGKIESFLVHLELCAFMFKNKSEETIRHIFNEIKKTYDNHALKQVNKIHPKKKSDPKDRDKLMRTKKREASDKMTLIGKQILQFLSDIKEKRIAQNAEYRIIHYSLSDIQKDKFSKWITELPNDEVFQRVVNPEKINEERLFLTVTHCRTDLKSVQKEVLDSIVNLSKTQEENIVDLTVDDLDQYWNTNHPKSKKLSNIQRNTTLQLLNEFRQESSNCHKRKRQPSILEDDDLSDSELAASTSSAFPDRNFASALEEEMQNKSIADEGKAGEPMEGVIESNSSLDIAEKTSSQQFRQTAIDTFMEFLQGRELSVTELQFIGQRISNVLEEKCRRNNLPQLFNLFIERSSAHPMDENDANLDPIESSSSVSKEIILDAPDTNIRFPVADAFLVWKEQFNSFRNLRKFIGSLHLLMRNILGFIHPNLYYIVNKRSWCTCRKEICSCEFPHSFPYSLYVRGCLHESKQFSLVLPLEKVFVAVAKDIAWCMRPFLWYHERFPTLVDNGQLWPTCVNAFQEATKSPLLLQWARKNRCSCQYDIKNVRNLFDNEIQSLKWLEKNVRTFLQRPHFRDNYDTPIRYSSPGNCLWTTFVKGSSIVSTVEDVDEEDQIERSLSFFDITEATILEIKSHYLLTQVAEYIILPDTLRRTSSQSSQTIWDFSDSFNSIVTDEEIKVVVLPVIRPRLFAALTFFAHATRLEILQNNDLRRCKAYSEFCSIVYNEANFEDISAEYSVQDEDVINMLLQRTPSSKLSRDKFDENFVVQSQVDISLRDTAVSLGDNLCDAINYHADTGLYLFRVNTTYVIDKGNKRLAEKLFVPILFCKDRKCFQTFGCIYENPAGVVLFRFITRSLKGLQDGRYISCNYLWNIKGQKWSNSNSMVLRGDTVFPYQITEFRLTVIVLIPTATQPIPERGSSFSMCLIDDEERITQNWSVKDQLSLGGYSSLTRSSFHLTQAVLGMMVFDLMSKFHYAADNKQSCFVSASLINEIQSVCLMKVKEIDSSLFPIHLLNFAQEILLADFNAVVHCFVSYKDGNEIDNWVYMYFIANTKTLYIMSRRCDPVREILTISSSIKCFLDKVTKSQINTVQLLWRDTELCLGNSGYYALKQFWKNANFIKINGGPPDYRCQKRMMLRPITSKQLEQLKKRCKEKLVRDKRDKQDNPFFYIGDFLLKD